LTKTFAALINPHRDPVKELNKLDDVLICSKLRLVIYLEDIDRNITSNNKTNDALYNEVAALLDRLKNLEKVSFVLTVKENRSELIRIAEHMEVVPHLHHRYVINHINKFKDICISQDNYIDSLIPEVRLKRLGMERIPPEEYGHAFDVATGVTTKEPINVIASLLNNPRTLKMVLRRTKQAWDSLRGEIDFDDLLVANVIRFVSPNTFLYINGRIDDIRVFGKHRSPTDVPSFLNDSLYVGLGNTAVGEDDFRNNIHILVDYLFPGWGKGKVNDAAKVPQGIAQFGDNDYWERLNREELFPEENRDQEVLKAINDWKINRSESSFRSMTLPEAIFLHQGFSDKMVYFGRILNVDEVLEIASTVFTISLRTNGKNTNGGNTLGFPQLSGLLGALIKQKLLHDGNIEKYNSWILGEIHKALPKSITFASNLIFSYGYIGIDIQSTLTAVQISEFANKIVTDAKNIYKNFDIMLGAVDPSSIFSISSFPYAIGKYVISKPEDWKWLSSLLLEAAERSSNIAVPQIAAILASQAPPVQYNDVITKASWWFEGSELKVMNLLAQEITLEGMNPKHATIVISVQKIAEEWLSKNSDKVDGGKQ